ncbi:MAG: DsbA family protein [Candidatus Nomurabacteria bacterium]|jgi:protein-disulfide isomerase|nr:DsbA family protein [Candidatus Nomurabacteria bacterium]
MNKRLWIVFVVLVLVALGGLIIWKKNGATDDHPNFDAQKLLTIDDVGKDSIPDHYIGNKDAKVIAIEYADFACVHCAQLSSTFKKIMEDYQDRVLFIYRNFSLSYPNSTISQSAAEAAFLLGDEEAYWRMHDLLFRDDLTWTGQAVSHDERKELLGDFAKTIGVDIDKLIKAVENYRGNGILEKINRDKELGVEVGVSGTPTWFINGKKIDEPSNEALRKAIEKALSSAS